MTLRDKACAPSKPMSGSLIDALDVQEVPAADEAELADWMRWMCTRRDVFESTAFGFPRDGVLHV